jgi:anti-sigma factor RsiW
MSPRHIPTNQLVDLLEGRLLPPDQATVRVHLDTCMDCGNRLDWLERLIGLMRDDKREEPPPRMIEAISGAFATHRPARRRLIGTARFDSAGGLPAGRRAGAGSERQIVFFAGDLAVDLRLTRADNEWLVSGQVIGGDRQGQVELHGQDTTIEADIIEPGEFELQPVAAGTYTLLLHMPKLEIEIPALEIGD